MTQPLWPMQERGINLVLDAIDRGVRRPLLTSPTGTGKSRTVGEIIRRVADLDWHCILYTNRQMLVDQLCRSLVDAGILFGVRAAGYDGDDDLHLGIQVSSLPTEASRVLKRKRWAIHGQGKPCLAVVDEAHLNAGDKAREIFDLHDRAGHHVLGVTATPLDLADVYDELLVAGTVSEGRECGALVEAIAYDFASPDLSDVPNVQEGKELTAGQAKKAMMRPGLIGRVFDAFRQINPDRRPSIGFAPGVAESIWFCEEFAKRGVKCAHIDGDDVWIDGGLHKSTPDLRKQVLAASKGGDVVCLWNRFVLREGIDAPWLSHGILATVMGSLQTFLQSGGRLLRAFAGKPHATFQDHGGNFMRHGSLNEDRVWFLEQTDVMAYGYRAAAMRADPTRQPFRCPQCGRLWVRGTVCNPARGGCGFNLSSVKKGREVVMADGTLRRISGDFFKPRRTYSQPGGERLWEQMYFRSITAKGHRTFRQAFALFARENNFGWPDRSWPLMPRNELDTYKHVADVPLEDLHGSPELIEKVRLYRAKREAAHA